MTAPMALDDSRDWMLDARLAILRLSITEESFSADDLRRVLGPAPHPNLVGLAFTAAHKAGDIEWVRYVRSNNKTRRGGSVSEWRAATVGVTK